MEKLPIGIDNSWFPYLYDSFQTQSMKYLRYSVLPKSKFLPESKNIFRVFQMPINKIKVVILGQDPYPKRGVAIGYAFAVSESTPKPFSLLMIEKELGHSIDKTLTDWIKQGVFLYNTALTVEENKPGSHLTEWSDFSITVIKKIAIHVNPIWVLWGKKASHFLPLIENSTDGKPDVLISSHPASEYYNKNAGFLGCNHFNMINNLLSKKEKQIINF